MRENGYSFKFGDLSEGTAIRQAETEQGRRDADFGAAAEFFVDFVKLFCENWDAAKNVKNV